MGDEAGRFYRPVPEGEVNAFREAEKRYRRPPTGQAAKRGGVRVTDWSEVMDFDALEGNSEANKARMKRREVVVGGRPLVRAYYTIDDLPGFVFIPNPFTDEEQVHWAEKCAKEYPLGNPTNVSNLLTAKWREEHPDASEEETDQAEKVRDDPTWYPGPAHYRKGPFHVGMERGSYGECEMGECGLPLSVDPPEVPGP